MMIRMIDRVICRCENVRLSDLQACMERPEMSLREVKLASRAGMGICQGRTCGSLLAALVGEHDSTADIHITRRAPVRPVSLAELADSAE